MKEELGIIGAVILAVMAVSYFIVNFGAGPTGLVIENLSIKNESRAAGESIAQNATQNDALQGINDSLEIMAEFIENNFSVFYVNDSIIEAGRTYEQARYAEILRNESESGIMKSEAGAALQLVEWEKISYNDVIDIANDIKERRQNAFVIYDSITALGISIQGYEGRGVNVTGAKKHLADARTAFYEDQYENSESLLNSVREELKLQAFSFSILNAVKRGLQSFIEKYWKKYWHLIVAGAVMASIFLYFAYRKYYEISLRRKIKEFGTERESLIELIKKTQEDRFKRNNIPGIVYNARMQKYKEKLAEVERNKAITEDKLNKILIPLGYLGNRYINNKELGVK